MLAKKNKKKAHSKYYDLKDLLIGLDDTLANKNKQVSTLITERNDLQQWKDNHACPAPPPHICPTPAPHNCPPCQLIHLPSPHVCPTGMPSICPIINNVNCSHSDYEELQKQIANFPTLLTEKKQELVKQIISELALDLNNNTSLEEVITEIKKLLNKPDTVSQAEVNLEDWKDLVSQKESQITALQTDLDNSQRELQHLGKVKERAVNSNVILGMILLLSYLFFLVSLRKTKRIKK